MFIDEKQAGTCMGGIAADPLLPPRLPLPPAPLSLLHPSPEQK